MRFVRMTRRHLVHDGERIGLSGQWHGVLDDADDLVTIRLDPRGQPQPDGVAPRRSPCRFRGESLSSERRDQPGKVRQILLLVRVEPSLNRIIQERGGQQI
jgi:hypothetical protein